MAEFFRGWRRKVGVMTLMIALVILGAWCRSFGKIDRFTFQSHNYDHNRLVSFKGSIAWQRVVPGDVSRGSTNINEFAPELFHELAESVAEHLLAGLLSNEDKFEWKHRLFGFEIGEHHHTGSSLAAVQVTIWKLSYWLLITPLTLFAAYLFLAKPNKSNQKIIADPIPEKSV